VFMLFRPGGIFARTEFGLLKPDEYRGRR